jgi:hypothetical protein
MSGKAVAMVSPEEVVSYQDIGMAKVWAHIERALVAGMTRDVRRALEGRQWEAA